MTTYNVKNNTNTRLVVLNGTDTPWSFADGDTVACESVALAAAEATDCGVYWFANGALSQPKVLSYTAATASYARTVAITTNSATCTGGAVASYTVSPALPTGLALNATTGAITGTPTGSTVAQTTYTVTATNAAGTATKALLITIT